MKVTILGCGSAGGVPSLSRGWGKCDPNEPRNRRMRPSILISHQNTHILVDTGPDCREQLVRSGIRHLDGVLFTHTHADHLHGIDDLREMNRVMNGPIDLYAAPQDLAEIQDRFAYVIGDRRAGDSIYKPMLIPNVIDGPFRIGDIDIQPFWQDHGTCKTLGFRFGSMAYSTDWIDFPPESVQVLQGIETWILSCLMVAPHVTHAHQERVLEWIGQINPKRAFLTHMTPILDYQTLCNSLPPHIRPCYDGLVIDQDGSLSEQGIP